MFYPIKMFKKSSVKGTFKGTLRNRKINFLTISALFWFEDIVRAGKYDGK